MLTSKGYVHTENIGFHKLFSIAAEGFHEANVTCQNDGAHLAIINSKQEEEVSFTLTFTNLFYNLFDTYQELFESVWLNKIFKNDTTANTNYNIQKGIKKQKFLAPTTNFFTHYRACAVQNSAFLFSKNELVLSERQ